MDYKLPGNAPVTNEEKIEYIYQTTKENNEILKTLRRQNYFSAVLKLFYWLLILGMLGGTYYYIRPFINTITTNGMKIGENLLHLNQVGGQLPEAKVIQQLLETLGQTKEE